jgi:hypothetical protein
VLLNRIDSAHELKSSFQVAKRSSQADKLLVKTHACSTVSADIPLSRDVPPTEIFRIITASKEADMELPNAANPATDKLEPNLAKEAADVELQGLTWPLT